MLPSRSDLATAGLRAAVQEMALGEERAHAFLDAYAELRPERRTALPRALAALDRIDAALHDFRGALRDLEAERAEGPQPPEMVRLRERPRAAPLSL